MTPRIETRFTQVVGCAVPIVQAPMGGAAGPRLVAAVASAGALGMLPAWTTSVEGVGRAVDAVRALTGSPFAVNIRADLVMADHIAAAVDHGVALAHLFWGDPAASARAARGRGARVMATVSDADTTKAALDAGACALIAQGVGAGGHVFGTAPLAELVPLVVELAGDVPVVGAGGLATADDAVGVFELGAAAAAYGTRFMMTAESDAHPAYQAAVAEAGSGETVLTECFDGGWPNAPHRVLRNATLSAWEAAGRPPAGSRPGEGEVVMRSGGGAPIARYSVALPTLGMTGDLREAALYAGAGCGRIKDVVPAAAFIEATAARLAAWMAGRPE